MEQRPIKRLPVVRGDDVLGMVSRANLVHALAGVARELLAELATEAWAPVGLIDVTVRNGVVELWGTITEARPGPYRRPRKMCPA